MDISHVFPIPFGIDNLKINQKELKLIFDYSNNSDDFTQNKSNNYASNDYFFLEKMPDLKKQIMSSIKEFTDRTINEKDELEITQSWVNMNPPGSSHHEHSHRNSIISGVFYIQTNADTGKFKIHKSENNFLSPNIRGDVNDYTTEYNYEYMYWTPPPNTLILFPSTLIHSVDTNVSEITRISLSFNTFYKLPFGNFKQKTGVIFP